MARKAKRPSGTMPPVAPGKRGRRTAAVAVKKPFPWGLAATVTLLVLTLGGVLVYAVTHQGSGYADPLKVADGRVTGVVKYDGLKRDHKAGPLRFAQRPPTGGQHNSVWSTCDGKVYDAQVPQENATHSLEHGAAWLAYRPDLPQRDVEKLAALVAGQPYRLMSPYPGLTEAVSLQAWGRQLKLDAVDVTRAKTFLDAYANGPQTPERGATCSGGTRATGATPAGA